MVDLRYSSQRFVSLPEASDKKGGCKKKVIAQQGSYFPSQHHQKKNHMQNSAKERELKAKPQGTKKDGQNCGSFCLSNWTSV